MSSPSGTTLVEKRTADANFTARACASTYAILGGIWTFMLVLVIYSARRDSKDAWQMISVLGCILLFILLWVGSFRISILGDTISYNSLWGGTRSLHLSEIEKAQIKIDAAEKFGAFYRLILWPESSALSPIVINMKVFGKPDLNRVFDFLGPKLEGKPRFSILSSE